MNLTQIIKSHLDGLDLDLTTPNNGRWTAKGTWIDQKVVPEVVSHNVRCILDYISHDNTFFTRVEIENSTYYIETYTGIFGKPDIQATRNESDKFISHTLKLLASAQILEIHNSSNKPFEYKVKNIELLELLTDERNTFIFLKSYIEKVLKDSGIFSWFEEYFAKQLNGTIQASDYILLRNRYVNFSSNHLGHNEPLHPRRILPKILNTLAAERGLRGTKGGSLSRDNLTLRDMIYRITNSRDSALPRGMSRAQFQRIAEPSIEYRIQRAKDSVKDRHDFKSEINNEYANVAHHILLKHEHGDFAAERENLIVLTPNQHNLEAHPNSNFRIADPDYQKFCLKKKFDNIKISHELNDGFYNLPTFIDMLNTLYLEDYGLLESVSTFDEVQAYLDQNFA